MKLVVWSGTYRYHVKRSYMYIYGKKGGNARHRPFMGAGVSFFMQGGYHARYEICPWKPGHCQREH